MLNRPRRNRKNKVVRAFAQETQLGVERLIYPLFVLDGKGIKSEVKSLPGNYRWSLDQLLPEVEACMNLGINSYVVFPAVSDQLKDKIASYSYAEENFYLHILRKLKETFPEICLMTDVAMDPYSSDGHDGYVNDKGEIVNDKTLGILAKMAVAQAQAGADIIGPSDMMDGRVQVIREALEDSGFTDVGILSYAAKYASSFYGPFRSALDSAPKDNMEIPKDKKTYQMDFHNSREALNEVFKDIEEGADIIMIKPGLPYLDIVSKVREAIDLPIAVYNVSGEYAMVKAAAQNGWLDNDKTIIESLTCFKRAGADMIFTYFAKEAAIILNI
jgi:porphobilinogen synthase